jgi:hypothetical protein
MTRLSHISNLSIALVLTAGATIEMRAPHSEPTPVVMTTDFAKVGSECVSFSGKFSSDDFFKGLRVVESPAGRKFMKGNTEIQEFPARVDTTINIYAIPCTSSVPHSEQQLTDWLHLLKFKTEWKRGTTLRPARSEFSNLSVRRLTTTDTEWSVDARIDSRSVPVSDHLVVSIVSQSGERVARLVGMVDRASER